MNGYRKYMIAEGGNLGWCKPYITDDGKIAFVECEGRVQDARIDGVDLETTHNVLRPQELTAESFAKLAHALHGKDYEMYDGYTDDERVSLAVNDGKIRECDCCDCPYFHDCEAMNNPDTWDEMPESAEYPDD